MSEHLSEYRKYFKNESRVEVSIPLPSGESFREWAVIESSTDDTIIIQLSRDTLPGNVRVDLGSIFDVGAWVKQEIFSCTSIVIEKLAETRLRLRLISPVTLKERRQFYRINENIWLKYACTDIPLREAREEWQERRKRSQLEFQGGEDYQFTSPEDEFRWRDAPPPKRKIEWIELFDAECSIGGGGIRFKIPKKLRPEEAISIELHLPSPVNRIVHLVGEVLYQLEPVTGASHENINYLTGIRFIYIEEADRELIMKFISQMQLQRLRDMIDKRPFRALDRPYSPPRVTPQKIATRIIFTVIALAAITLLVRYAINYQRSGSSDQIRQIYQKELKEYRKE